MPLKTHSWWKFEHQVIHCGQKAKLIFLAPSKFTVTKQNFKPGFWQKNNFQFVPKHKFQIPPRKWKSKLFSIIPTWLEEFQVIHIVTLHSKVHLSIPAGTNRTKSFICLNKHYLFKISKEEKEIELRKSNPLHDFKCRYSPILYLPSSSKVSEVSLHLSEHKSS